MQLPHNEQLHGTPRGDTAANVMDIRSFAALTKTIRSFRGSTKSLWRERHRLRDGLRQQGKIRNDESRSLAPKCRPRDDTFAGVDAPLLELKDVDGAGRGSRPRHGDKQTRQL